MGKIMSALQKFLWEIRIQYIVICPSSSLRKSGWGSIIYIVYIPIKCFQQANNWEVSDMRNDDHVQLSSWLVQCDRMDRAVDTEKKSSYYNGR